MDAGWSDLDAAPGGDSTRADLGAAPPSPPPVGPAELRAFVHGGENDSDLCETILACTARIEAALRGPDRELRVEPTRPQRGLPGIRRTQATRRSARARRK